MINLERRELLKLGAVAGALAIVGTRPLAAGAAPSRISLEALREMSPVQMAEASDPAMASWESVRSQAAEIRNPALRRQVTAILDNPAPTLMKRIGTSEKKAIHKELVAEKLIEGVSEQDFLPPVKDASKTSQPFYAAPGSGYQSHHAYPGGLATHTDLNVRVSKALADGYLDVYGYGLDRDVVIASQLLHDLHKPWVFQWQANGESRTEMKLAGTGEHHPLGVAESIARGLPADVIVAQACAHNHPRTPEDEAQVVGWLKAAAILNGIDPVQYGLLEKGGKTLPLPRRQEGFVCHLGDHDWVLTVPAAQWIIPVVQTVALRDYGIKADDAAMFNRFRNYVFSQVSIMSLYETYAAKGEAELTRVVHGLVQRA